MYNGVKFYGQCVYLHICVHTYIRTFEKVFLEILTKCRHGGFFNPVG